MYERVECSKIKWTLCNVPTESPGICNVLPKPVGSNGLIAVKLKQDLKYSSYVYFESVRPCVIYQALDYLKPHDKFYEGNSISRDLLSFSEKESTKEENFEAAAEKIIQNEPPFILIEDALNMHRTTSSETALVSEMSIIIDKENDIIAPGHGKAPSSLLHDQNGEELAVPYPFSKGKLGYSVR